MEDINTKELNTNSGGGKQGNKTHRFIQASIIVAIVIVMNLFFNYAVSLVYQEPVYEDFVKPAQVVNTVNTKEVCLSVGGQWSETAYPTEVGKSKVQGYCDENYTKQQKYNEARKAYEKKVFITLVVLGVLSLVLGGFVAIQLLSVAFAWGGVLSLVIASMRYWSEADNLAKVVILAIALALLIWLAVKKFNK